MELDVAQPLLLAAGEGEIVGDSEDRRVEILCDLDELCVTWTRFGPGRDGANPHIHRHHTDLFYVLDGELTVGLGADRQETSRPGGDARGRAAVRRPRVPEREPDGGVALPQLPRSRRWLRRLSSRPATGLRLPTIRLRTAVGRSRTR